MNVCVLLEYKVVHLFILLDIFNTLWKPAVKAAELSRMIWVYNSVLISHYTKRKRLHDKNYPGQHQTAAASIR